MFQESDIELLRNALEKHKINYYARLSQNTGLALNTIKSFFKNGGVKLDNQRIIFIAGRDLLLEVNKEKNKLVKDVKILSGKRS